MLRFPLFACLAAVSVTVAPAAAAPKRTPSVRRLTDADLLRYAARRFDARKMMFHRAVVGLHRGTLVVADHPCGDVCPQYTRRIIHYDVDLSLCPRIGGVVVQESVPHGIATLRQPFCEPAILATEQPTR